MINQLDPPLVAAGVSFVLIGLAWGYSTKVARSRPNEPRLLPGAVPILGHALSFGKDASKLYEVARDWSTDLQPVSLSLLGQRIYVIFRPRDVAAVWRTKNLAFEPIVEWGLQAMFGLTPEGAHNLHGDPDGEGDMYISQHTYFRDALAPGSNLVQATRAFLKYLAEDVIHVSQEIKNAPGAEIKVNLMDWVRDRVGVPSTQAFIGRRILEHDPSLINRFAKWEKDFLLLSLNLPKWVLKKTHENLNKLCDDFRVVSKDPEMLPWLVRRIEMGEIRGLSPMDSGASLFTLWMALQANAVPSSFWMFYQIVSDPTTHTKIQAEIAPAFDAANNLVDLDHLLQNAPLFNSIYWETLRWTSGAVSVRKVEEDTVIGGTMFYAGALVMVPARAMHLSKQVFGEDAEDFVPDRFIRNPADLKSVRAFGGGNTLCPGRHFASNEVLAWVSTALRTFNVSILAGQTPARPRTAGANAGTLLPDREVLATVKLKV